MKEPATPEHEKLKEIKDQSQAIGQFIDWMSETYGAHFYHMQTFTELSTDMYGKPRLHPDGSQKTHKVDRLVGVGKSTELLLAEFFSIDLDKIEDEKRAMLAYCREQKT